MDDVNFANDHEPSTTAASFGSIGVFLSAGLVFLAVVDRTGGLPFRMPPVWYVNPELCYFGIAGLFIFGCALLKRRRRPAVGWKPTHAGVRFDSLVLYTRKECPLCDEAKETLLEYSQYLPEICERDIDVDAELIDRFGNCVPVVEIDGKVRFRGRVHELLLHRLIEGTAPRHP